VEVLEVHDLAHLITTLASPAEMVHLLVALIDTKIEVAVAPRAITVITAILHDQIKDLTTDEEGVVDLVAEVLVATVTGSMIKIGTAEEEEIDQEIDLIEDLEGNVKLSIQLREKIHYLAAFLKL
jgi:hypothetical protein